MFGYDCAKVRTTEVCSVVGSGNADKKEVAANTRDYSTESQVIARRYAQDTQQESPIELQTCCTNEGLPTNQQTKERDDVRDCGEGSFVFSDTHEKYCLLYSSVTRDLI